jgi:hypothetical protein
VSLSQTDPGMFIIIFLGFSCREVEMLVDKYGRSNRNDSITNRCLEGKRRIKWGEQERK